jgi:hypothetical protein
VLVTPEGRMQKHGLLQLAMPKLSGPWRPLLIALVRGLKLEAHVPTPLYAPPDARIVLHRATQRVWVDGVLCAKVTETSFKVLEVLVDANGNPVHTHDIAEHLRGKRWHDDTTRKAVEALIQAIETSFKEQKKQAPKDLRKMIRKPRHGQWVLTVVGFAD